MKKILTLAAATLLFAATSFAQEKKCTKGKDCCNKKEIAKKGSDSKVAKATVSLKRA